MKKAGETRSEDPRRLIGEQVRILYMQAPVSNATVLVIALLFYFILSSLVESALVGFWVLALYGTASLRLGFWYLYKTRPDAWPAQTWLKCYLVGSGLMGVSWSLIYPLIYIANDQVVFIALLMLVFGVVGSAVAVLSACFPVFVVYTYPQILMLFITLLYFDDATYYLLALGVLTYLLMITLFTRYTNRQVLRSIALQAQNLGLIDELSQEVSQRESLVEQRTAELRRKNTELTREIGQRERAEASLRESEERFNLAMRGANDGLYDWNLLTNEIYYSPRWKGMLGYADDELENNFSAWKDLVDPIDRERSWNMLTDYINGRRDNFRMEFKLRHKDGRWVDTLSRAFLVRDPEGKAVRVVGTHLDISEEKRWQNALRDSEAYLKALSEATYEAILIFRQDVCIGQNPAAEKMFGYATEQAMGRRDMEWIAPESRGLVGQHLVAGPMQPFEAFGLRSGGQVFPIEIQGRMMHYKGEQVRVTSVRDISERRRKDEKIRLLSQALEQSPVLVVITDTDARIEYVNSTFERVTGYSASEVIGRNPNFLQSGLTSSKRYQELWSALSEGRSWNGEIQNRKKNGDIYWEHAHIAPVLDSSGRTTHFLAVKEDISDKKDQEERILRQAHFDGLTHLPNRFLALDRLTQLIKEAGRTDSRVAVLFIDLDGFKRVNDSLGHEAGDLLLVQAAQRLSATVRDGDTVCRLGGDEFIVLLSGLSHAAAARPVAESLVFHFRGTFRVERRELVVTASIGIAVFPEDGTTPMELLRNADTAMYHSKEQGRNTYHYFTDAMNKDVSRRLAVEEQLHGALGRAEFSILYQPLVNLQSGRIIGAEALLRWNNTVLDVVSPDEFIPIAEQTGSIMEIGSHVLAESLNWLKQWKRVQGPEFKIAVNLSPRQFRDPGLVASIEQVLQKYGAGAESLELEITEGVLMSGHTYIDRALSTLKALGVGIAMDDFGTGYSSLSYLRSYPFDALKIDRSFVSDLTIDPADRELVNAAILMAHGLGLRVIAEGVETEEQLACLREMGCECAQGYLFSKPISGQAFSELLEMRAVS